MRGKFFSVLFALVLVLSFSLVAAVPAAAATDSDIITLFATGKSTATWVTSPAKVGDCAVELTMPAENWPVYGDRAEVRIPISGAPTISQIGAWDFWTISPASYTIPIEFLVDTTGDGEGDRHHNTRDDYG